MKTLYKILKECSEGKTPAERVSLLQQNGSGAVQIILKHAFDPAIKFLLPEGPAPFKPAEVLDQEGRLYSELRRLYLFVEGGNPNITTIKREMLFIQLLESIDKDDAELLVSVKDKKLPFKSINEKLVRQAFPNLLSEVSNEQNAKKK